MFSSGKPLMPSASSSPASGGFLSISAASTSSPASGGFLSISAASTSSPASGGFLSISAASTSSPASGGFLSISAASTSSPASGGFLSISAASTSSPASGELSMIHLSAMQNFSSASGSGREWIPEILPVSSPRIEANSPNTNQDSLEFTEKKYVYRNSGRSRRRRRRRVRWPQQPSTPTFEIEDEMDSFDISAVKYGSKDSSKSRPLDWGFSKTEISEIKFCTSSWGNWRRRYYEDEAEEREIHRSKIQSRRPVAVVRPNVAEHRRKSLAAAKQNYGNSVLPTFQHKRYELDRKIAKAMASLRLSNERPDPRPNFQSAPELPDPRLNFQSVPELPDPRPNFQLAPAKFIF